MLEESVARGWENLIGRWDGPMSFRCLIQPAVAIVIAIQAGLSDARQDEPQQFLWAVLSNSDRRQERLRQVWKDVGTVFVIALILDSIYQVVVHAGIYTLELFITATVLAVVPYVISRPLVAWIARLAGVGKQSAQPTVNNEESKK